MTSPTPQPQGASPDAGASPDQGGAPAPQPQGSQQANGLQVGLAKLMNLVMTLGSQNQIIQPEMQEVATSLRKALLKVGQAGQPQAQAQTPQQQ